MSSESKLSHGFLKSSNVGMQSAIETEILMTELVRDCDFQHSLANLPMLVLIAGLGVSRKSMIAFELLN